MTNLDYICVGVGQKLAEIDENILRKALGIIREDGVYAMFLWLENNDKNVRKKLLQDKDFKIQLVGGSQISPDDDFNKFIEELKKVTQDIDRLFFLKKILERTLTYGLYHSKLNSKT